MYMCVVQDRSRGKTTIYFLHSSWRRRDALECKVDMDILLWHGGTLMMTRVTADCVSMSLVWLLPCTYVSLINCAPLSVPRTSFSTRRMTRSLPAPGQTKTTMRTGRTASSGEQKTFTTLLFSNDSIQLSIVFYGLTYAFWPHNLTTFNGEKSKPVHNFVSALRQTWWLPRPTQPPPQLSRR